MDKNKLDWDYPTPHCINITVETIDLDDFDHVNNARYVQWCETCAWSHSNSLGLDIDAYKRLDRAMVVKTAHIDYLAPANAEQSLKLGTWITYSDNKLSLERAYQLIRVSDGKTLLRGRTLFVCVELSSGKPRRMPAEFVTGYNNVCIHIQPQFI